MGHDPSLKETAIRLYLEGMSFRGVGRVLGVNFQSVINRVKPGQTGSIRVNQGQSGSIRVNQGQSGSIRLMKNCLIKWKTKLRQRAWNWTNCLPLEAKKEASIHRNGESAVARESRLIVDSR